MTSQHIETLKKLLNYEINKLNIEIDKLESNFKKTNSQSIISEERLKSCKERKLELEEIRIIIIDLNDEI